MRRVLTLFVLLFCAHLAFSQSYVTAKTASPKLKKIYERGVQLTFNSHLKAALSDMERVLEMEPKFIDAQIAWANIQYDLKNFEAAREGFLKVIAIDENYSSNAFYNLGLIEKQLKEYDSSAKYFEKYLNSNPKSQVRRKRAQDHLKNTEFMAEAYKNPVKFEPINLGGAINSSKDEYLPTLTADGERLIFIKFDGVQEDFYVSRKVNGEWQPSEPITNINTPMNEGGQTMTPDGKILIFTMCERRTGFGGCDLYITEYSDGDWTKPRIMDEPVNSRANEKQPSISADGNTLYFASNRNGTKGGMDIWKSERLPSGAWKTPENLTVLNTVKDDRGPMIHPDGLTLYFMSNGHPGFGENDLFFARKNDKGVWSLPKNLGTPINTEKSEGLIFVSTDGKTALFASNRKDYENAQGRYDIYSFELDESIRPNPVTYVKGEIKDIQTLRKLAARVEIIDIATGEIHSTIETADDGEFLITLPIGKDYLLNVNKEKYLFHSENFALKGKADIDEPFVLKIDLIPIPESIASTGETPKPKSKPIILKNVFFETGSAELLSQSLLELNRLKELLEKNASLKIQINGHTDNVGSDEDNLTLSANRAKAVYDFLIEQNIDSSRLKYKGFGESDPIATNTTEEGRSENRRTEFILLE